MLTNTHAFNGPLSSTARVSRYQKGKINLDFTEARDRECQWHQLGRMQVCTSLHTDNHASTRPPSFFTGRVPFLMPNQQYQSTEGKLTKIKISLTSLRLVSVSRSLLSSSFTARTLSSGRMTPSGKQAELSAASDECAAGAFDIRCSFLNTMSSFSSIWLSLRRINRVWSS